jgi:microcystin synthetase protein McyB
MSDRNIETAFELSPLQEGMLYHTIRHPDSSLYRGQCTATLSGPLDDRLFRRAWALAAERHQAFRTFYAWERRERPLQVVRARVDLPWTVEDWSDEPHLEQDRRWNELLESDRGCAFDLVQAPIMRFALVHLGDERHRFLWSLHHALADGWSGMLVMREVLADYAALHEGSEPDRPAPPSFATFITWLGSRDAVAAEAYWRKRLAGFVEPTPLPGAVKRPAGNARATTELVLDERATPALHGAAARFRVTPNTIAVGAWALVLARYATPANEVTFGVTISERPPEIPGVDRSVGLFLHTVTVRVPVSADASLESWLVKLQRTLSDGRDQSVGGLAEIRRWSELSRAADLVRSLVVYESFPADVVEQGAEGALRIDSTTISAPSDLPLALLVYPDENLTLQLVYDPSLYDEETAARLLAEAARTLMALTTMTDGQVGDLDVLGPETRKVLLESWSGAHLPRPPAPDVLERFEAQAGASPTAVAVRCGDAEISYGALDQAANRLAHRIVDQGLEAGALLGIPAVRSTDTVIAILAAMKSGHGYTLVDPDQPAARLRGILAEVDRVLPVAGIDGAWDRTLRMDEAEGGTTDKPAVTSSPESVAYVIWTSGTTGAPKGVVVERGQLARSTAARLHFYGELPERFLLLSSFAVDSAVAGFYWSLCTGGCLVLPPSRAEQDVEGLARLIEGERITATLLVPALYGVLLDEVGHERLASLRTVVVAGDSCQPSLVGRHKAHLRGTRLLNEYGPSEATVWATVADLTAADEPYVTIGRPVPFVRLYLLDAESRLVPVGAPGEICIGGDTIARGYLNQDDLSARRFVHDPFHEGGRMYRTGDSARFLPDGRLEFLGRLDDQVKIRGFRVEPAEIERVLESDRDISEAAVVLEASPAPIEPDELARLLIERAGPDADDLLSDLLETRR